MMSKVSLKDAIFCRFKAVLLIWYSGVPISQSLEFSNLPIIRAKRRVFFSFRRSLQFYLLFLALPVFGRQFFFPWRFEELGFQCISEYSVVTEWPLSL